MSADSKVLIQLQADTKDINAKLASLGDVLSTISTHTKNIEGLGKTTWAVYATGINQVMELGQKALGVFRDIARVMLQMAEAAGHQEAAEIKLEAAMRAHGVTSAGVVRALVNQASALQKLTGESDEAILNVQVMLTSMGVMPSKLDAATRAALDISRVFGKDLQGSATLVAQAMEGNTRGIVKLIPALKGMEKGALDADGVLRKLHEAMGGVAERESESYLAQLRKLKAEWNDLREVIGKYVIPTLREVIELTRRGIHAIEGLLGVETLAWKKKELDILDKAIAKAEERERKQASLTDSQRAMLAQGGDLGTADVYKGMNIEQARARAEELRRQIAGEMKQDQEEIAKADKEFKKERSHALDELIKKWQQTIPKLKLEVEFAGAPGGGGYFREQAEAEAERLKLREEYAKILNRIMPGEKETVGALIDQVAAAKKLNAEKKAYMEFAKIALDVDQQMRERSQYLFDLSKKRGEAAVQAARDELELGRTYLTISRGEYSQGQIDQYEKLIALEEERYELLDKSLMTERQQIEAEDEKNRKVTEYRNRIRGLQHDLQVQTGTGDEGFGRGIKEWLDEQKSAFEQMRDFAKGIAEEMSSIFGELFFDVFEGKMKDLGDYLTAFAKNVSRMLANMLGQMAAQSLISGVSGLSLPSFSYHEGGRGIAEASGFRLVPAEAFASARRYHSGLTPDEVPLIVQRREMPFVFTPEQMKGLAGMMSQSMSLSMPITVDDQSKGRRLQRTIRRAVDKEVRGWL